jgi:hypothetical protein
MKKLLYSSIVLTVFSLSIILFQISCQEEAVAKETAVQNKFLYSIAKSPWQYWIANTDGSNPVQIPISLPASLNPAGSGRLTPDGQTLIFPVWKTGTDDYFVYSVSINGSNLKKIIDTIVTEQLDINQTF